MLENVELSNHRHIIITCTVGTEDHCLERGVCSESNSMIQMVIKKYFEDLWLG
jgi:hypothetical protein